MSWIDKTHVCKKEVPVGTAAVHRVWLCPNCGRRYVITGITRSGSVTVDFSWMQQT